MNTNQHRTVRRSALVIGVALMAATTFSSGLAFAQDSHGGVPTPVTLRPATESPTPPPPDPHQANQAVSNECFGTPPNPGSTPAHPRCDWKKIFADTEARAAAAQQQQRTQFDAFFDRDR